MFLERSFVGANQADVGSLTGTSNNPPVHQAPFIEAPPIDLLSIHFTGRKMDHGCMTKAFERTRRKYPFADSVTQNREVITLTVWQGYNCSGSAHDTNSCAYNVTTSRERQGKSNHTVTNQ
jgi:hypothetical protein